MRKGEHLGPEAGLDITTPQATVYTVWCLVFKPDNRAPTISDFSHRDAIRSISKELVHVIAMAFGRIME